ncbi:hypothetical protein P0Y31_08515 [Knoellia sp. 3-2P3]|uniref:SCO7613 C-terminal domain-containing membrane protein n=1 Tax=unclassified Knoellia TaxID=2618719 RepID=UPI0023DC7E46|nr:hypothetical protein [Knoellia sp. 3-2P3]MDF2092383.1 hypothetical protein [Knoellia sp. 3-2P3]
MDQSLAALARERARLLQALREQRSPAGAVAARSASTGPTNARPPHLRPRWSGQQVLLGTGVLLVLVASLVFLAVAWDVIGVAGQVLAMATLTCLTAYGALRLSRQRLHGSAEALGALTAGLLLLDVAAARSLGLGGLEALDVRTYSAVTGTLVAVALAALHTRDRRVSAFGIGSLVAATTAWAAVLGWATGPVAGFAAVALAGAVVFAVAAALLPTRLGVVRAGAVVPAVMYLLVSLVVAVLAGFDDLYRDGLSPEDAGAVVVLVVIATGGYAVLREVLRRRSRGLGTGRAADAWLATPLAGTWWPLSALAAAVGVAAPAALTSLAWQAGPVTTGVASVLLATALGTLAWRSGTRWSRTRWTLLGLGATTLVGLVGASDHWGSQATASVAVAAVAAVSAALCVLRPDLRAIGSAVAALTGAVSVGLAAELLGAGWLVAALTVSAVGLTALAAWRRGHADELSLGVTAVLAATAAQAWAAGEGWAGTTSLLLVLEGGVSASYAVLLRRRPLVVVAALAWTGAVWVLVADSDVTTPEAYSLPAAAFALAAGLWLLHTTPGLSSWVSVGPAAALALLPSALVSVDEEGLVRPMLTLVAAAAVLASASGCAGRPWWSSALPLQPSWR